MFKTILGYRHFQPFLELDFLCPERALITLYNQKTLKSRLTMNEIITHQNINKQLCGSPLDVKEGFARVSLKTTNEMSVDNKGLVHGGFVFGLADYAAMIAVNDPNVVLGSAQTRFKKPVKAGHTVEATATIVEEDKNKRLVDVTVTCDELEVFAGQFTCFILDKHVLD